jgi:hypothetical protein
MARVVPRIVQSLLPGAAPTATAFPGPTRQDALELIAQAQRRARRFSARLRGDAAPRLAPDSSVAGNA